ncbi:MAG: glycoside hydrolase family 2 protein [Bacteroidota bacterium]
MWKIWVLGVDTEGVECRAFIREEPDSSIKRSGVQYWTPSASNPQPFDYLQAVQVHSTMIRSFALLLSCSMLFPTSITGQIQQQELTDWQFQQVGATDWQSAIVPGSVQLNLLQSGQIEDPFYRDNEAKVQWISDEDWAFKTTFSVEPSTLNQQYVQLVFDGLDTYATIELNGQPIGQTNNFFRTWKIPVKEALQEGDNELIITFEAPAKRSARDFKAIGYNLPGGQRVVSRKPQFHFGWDWGPTIIRSGIHRPVRLEAWSGPRIEDLYIQQKSVTVALAKLEAQVEISSSEKRTVPIKLLANGQIILEKTIPLKAGTNNISLPFEIPKPDLWWCVGMGEQARYHFELLLDESQKKALKTGLRSIELVTEKDAIGESFYFRLNGKRVFAKGANYIPVDILQGRVKQADYERLINDALAANMNMLRIWGGGQYENDEFYELCDQKGILIWQDFMFACAMYPGDQAFMENVRQEAIDNIKRLRNHPCIALWCGNNENSEGWHRWGWKLQVPPFKIRRIWKDYKRLFQQQLPQLVSDYHSEIDYWESSPKMGRGNPKHQFEGDSHYWGVWHDAEPFEMFLQKVPRFMSEFGFQSFPNWQTMKSFTEAEDRSLESEVMTVHQKHPRGNKLIRTYMDRKYPVPENFEEFVYASQIVQAEGMRLGIEAHRLSQPRCMGTLYWQLNDVWPVASWSSIDYYGRWKAMHYAVRDAFAQVNIVPRQSKEVLRLFVQYEGLDTLETLLHLHYYHLKTGTKGFTQQPVELLPKENQIGAVVKIRMEAFAQYGDLSDLQLQAQIMDGSTLLAERSVLFANPKALVLPDPQLSWTIEAHRNGPRILMHSKAFAHQVYLEWEGTGNFSDNFFDLLPSPEGKMIQLPIDTDIEVLEKTLKVRSFYDLQR